MGAEKLIFDAPNLTVVPDLVWQLEKIKGCSQEPLDQLADDSTGRDEWFSTVKISYALYVLAVVPVFFSERTSKP